MNTTKEYLKSILLVDDTQHSLDLYSELLRKKTNAHVMCCRHPGMAIKLAEKYFFDIILIDVTITYNDTQFGGLEVYKKLKARYGDSSLIVYSQFITDDLLRQYDYEFNFIENREDPKEFIDECIKLMISLKEKTKLLCGHAIFFDLQPCFQCNKKSMQMHMIDASGLMKNISQSRL